MLQKLFQPRDLAFAKTRRARHFASEATVDLFGFRGDQVLHAKGARDGCGDEAIGRGNNRHQIGVF